MTLKTLIILVKEKPSVLKARGICDIHPNGFKKEPGYGKDTRPHQISERVPA
jgi:hypothetical protein